jgi:ABC-type branched-subunit amino acid transport system permease subunit
MHWRSHIALGFAVAFIAVAPTIFGTFTITLMNYIGIYAFAALGLVLLTGLGGLTSFGQAAFVGIGAYATAWYTAVQGGSPWVGLLLALALTGLVALILGATTLRLSGHFLPLSTIAWGVAIYFVFGNLDALNRYSGLSGIPPISIGPLSLGGTIAAPSCCSATTSSIRGRDERSAVFAAGSPWWRASRSTAFGCGWRSSFWPDCSPASPVGSMPTCSGS